MRYTSRTWFSKHLLHAHKYSMEEAEITIVEHFDMPFRKAILRATLPTMPRDDDCPVCYRPKHENPPCMALYDNFGNKIKKDIVKANMKRHMMLMSMKTGEIVGYLCPHCKEQFALFRFYELHIWDNCDHLNPADPIHTITKSMASSSIADSPPPLGSKRAVKASAPKTDTKRKPTSTGVVPVSSREPNFNRYLVTHNLIRVNEVGDGNCMWRALARYIRGHPSRHNFIRDEVVPFMERNPELFRHALPEIGFDDAERAGDYGMYIERMRMNGEEGDNAVLAAAAVFYRITIHYFDVTTGTEYVLNPGATPAGEHPLYMRYHTNDRGDNGHWDTLQPLAAAPAAAPVHLGIIPGLDDAVAEPDAEPAVPSTSDETDGQQEVVPNAGAGSSPATCARCKRPLHLGKICSGAPPDVDTDAAAEPAAEPAAAPADEPDAEPAAQPAAEPTTTPTPSLQPSPTPIFISLVRAPARIANRLPMNNPNFFSSFFSS
jgi:hypothetical protein